MDILFIIVPIQPLYKNILALAGKSMIATKVDIYLMLSYFFFIIIII